MDRYESYKAWCARFGYSAASYDTWYTVQFDIAEPFNSERRWTVKYTGVKALPYQHRFTFDTLRESEYIAVRFNTDEMWRDAIMIYFRLASLAPRPPIGSCLSKFSLWWDGLNKIERPPRYVIKRHRKSIPSDFVPKLYKAKRTFEWSGRVVGGGEYWIGLRPDGGEVFLGSTTMFSPEQARESYVRKLAYWGRKPSQAEDLAALEQIPYRDIYEVRMPVPLSAVLATKHRFRGGEHGVYTLGDALGVW